MNVRVNGQPRQVEGQLTLRALLSDLGYHDMLVAVAVNRTCIKRSELGQVQVQAGDEIEILAPMAGG